MNINGLELFVLSADRLNISAAGRDLGLAPAVASARLAKLENQLGVELLHRSTRKVALSPDGEAFLPYAREILAQSEAGRAVVGQGKSDPSGILRFAAPSSFAQLHIIDILPEFHELYPNITLDLRLSDTRFNTIEGSFDLALRSAPLQDSSLKGRKLSADRRILCASPTYLETHGTPQFLADLAGHNYLAWANLSSKQLINVTNEIAELNPREMRCRNVFDDGTSLRMATLTGAGISINSRWSVAHEIARGKLIQILPDWKLNDSSFLWLFYPQSNVLTPKVRCFMDFLIRKLGSSETF